MRRGYAFPPRMRQRASMAYSLTIALILSLGSHLQFSEELLLPPPHGGARWADLIIARGSFPVLLFVSLMCSIYPVCLRLVLCGGSVLEWLADCGVVLHLRPMAVLGKQGSCPMWDCG